MDSDSDSDDDGPSFAQRRASWEQTRHPPDPQEDTPASKKRKKETKPRARRNSQEEPRGSIAARRLNSSESPWWSLINHADVRNVHSFHGKRFRRKFRLPMCEVDTVIEEAQKVDKWRDKPGGIGNGRGQARNPLLLKVLAALRHLCKGIDAETLEDVALISESSLDVFFREFINWMATVMYPKYIKLPDAAKLKASTEVYAALGFPGAYCETDGVHLEWDACPAAWRARCVGKESYPTIAFNVSILHSREIIHVSDWCSGATNDLTQAKHDALFEALHTESQRGLGVPDAQLKYMLLNKDGVEQQFEQLYAIVDGGYHAWRCLQAPLKHAAGDDAARWSERLESVRKSVECTFGILRERFIILNRPLNYTDPKRIDSMFRSCCVLHNMLLKYDKLDTLGSLQSDWVPAKEVAERDHVEHQRARHVIRAPRNSGKSAAGLESGHESLREALIVHYAQMRKAKSVKWLRTASDARPSHPFDEDDEGEGEDDEDFIFEDDGSGDSD